MPYTHKKVGSKYAVYKKGKKVGETEGTKQALNKYLAALHVADKKTTIKESIEDGQIGEVYAVVAPYPGCTPDSLVKPIDPLNGISGTEISPDQVHGVYSGADQAMMIAERMCAEYEKGQRVLEEKKGTTTEKLKKAIDKLEKKRKEHMDAMKEDPKSASEHKASIADLATKIDDYITKLEKIEKSKNAEEKKEEKKDDKKSLKESTKYDLVGPNIKNAAEDYAKRGGSLSNREYDLVKNAFIEGILWSLKGRP